MSKTKIGVFGVLAFSVMMLLIPATSIANAQEYDRYYQEKDRYNQDKYSYDNDKYYDDYRKTSYDNEYKKVDKKENDRPVIIVENKIPIPQKDKEKKKEQSMILVNKEVLFCDSLANGTSDFCEGEGIPGPNSDRWVQQCNDEQCEDIDVELFTIKIDKDVEFQGSEDGTKINLSENTFVVKESGPVGDNVGPFGDLCEEAGFDDVTVEFLDNDIIISCLLYEGECSGIIEDEKQRECTVKNHIIAIDF